VKVTIKTKYKYHAEPFVAWMLNHTTLEQFDSATVRYFGELADIETRPVHQQPRK
jgi:hypothetical protein